MVMVVMKLRVDIYIFITLKILLFDKECRRLLKDIAYYDVLRPDRSISCHGLKARTHLFDKQFVDLYLSIPLPKDVILRVVSVKILLLGLPSIMDYC